MKTTNLLRTRVQFSEGPRCVRWCPVSHACVYRQTKLLLTSGVLCSADGWATKLSQNLTKQSCHAIPWVSGTVWTVVLKQATIIPVFAGWNHLKTRQDDHPNCPSVMDPRKLSQNHIISPHPGPVQSNSYFYKLFLWNSFNIRIFLASRPWSRKWLVSKRFFKP
jgi:hypothetical protein